MTDQPTPNPDVSTKDHPGAYDALETAKEGEPIFVVQGGDPRGPGTVQFWAEYARACSRAVLRGAKVVVGQTPFDLVDGPEDYQPSQADQREAERLLLKATNAEQVSWAMQAYQRGEEEQGAYQADDTLAEQLMDEAADRAAQRKMRITMTGALNNAAGIAFEVAEGLSRSRLLPMADAKVREAVALLKAAAEEVEPRRGMERS
jgi:hypothetical protein